MSDNISLLDDPLLAAAPVAEGYKVLGPVALFSKLGQGGMGAVYKGRHARLNIDVVVKVMIPPAALPPAQQDQYVKRFVREASIAASIHHQNLVHVSDVNSQNGLHFLIMEYVDGESAADVLKRKGRLSEVEALRIISGAADGLAEAHSQGIVHRDIKPANILISKDGKVKVADLGLAKAIGGDSTDGGDSQMTMSHATMGTPHYMSPEQIESARDVSFPADVWSLGVTLYQLLANALPWNDETLRKLINKICDESPMDIRAARPDISEPIAEIIDRCLKKSPSDRYAHCGDMAAAVKKALDSVLASQPAIAETLIYGVTGERSTATSKPDSDIMQKIALTLNIEGLTDAKQSVPKSSATPEDRTVQIQADSPTQSGGKTAVTAKPAKKKLWVGAVIVLAVIALAAGLYQRQKQPVNSQDRINTEPLRRPVRDALERRQSSLPVLMKPELLSYFGEWNRAQAVLNTAEEKNTVDSWRKALDAFETADRLRIKNRIDDSELDGKDPRPEIIRCRSKISEGLDEIALLQKSAAEKTESGDIAGAVVAYDKALDSDPSNLDALLKRGDANAKLGKINSAINDYNRGLEIEPQNIDMLLSRANAKFLLKDYNAAIDDCDKALSVDKTQPTMWHNRGFFKMHISDWHGAISDFDRSLELKPSDAMALYNRGFSKYSINDWPGAAMDFSKTLTIEPDHPLAKRLRDMSIAKEAIRMKDWKIAKASLDAVLAATADDSEAKALAADVEEKIAAEEQEETKEDDAPGPEIRITPGFKRPGFSPFGF
ncbi:MAG: protein kinase [Planctomycetota bacterium]